MAVDITTETQRTQRFADAFWDDGDQGIQRITERLQASQQTCEEILNLYEHRAKIEDDYGERLLQLSQVLVGQTEEGTLSESISYLPSAIETTARAHADLAQQLRLHLQTPLLNFIKEQGERREQQQKRIEEANQNRQTLYANAARARDHYMGECSKLNSMERYINERSADMIPDEIQQIREEIEEERRLVREADLEFKNATMALEEANKQWVSDWRSACDMYQEMEEIRISLTRSSLWAFANMVSSVYIVGDQCCERIRTALESTNVQKDIEMFVAKYGTGNKMPDTIRYENFAASLSIAPLSPELQEDPEDAAQLHAKPLPKIPLASTTLSSNHAETQPETMPPQSVASSVSTETHKNTRVVYTPQPLSSLAQEPLPMAAPSVDQKAQGTQVSAFQNLGPTPAKPMSQKSPRSAVSPSNDSVVSSVNGNEFVEYVRHEEEQPAKGNGKRDAIDTVFKEVESMLGNVGTRFVNLYDKVKPVPTAGEQAKAESLPNLPPTPAPAPIPRTSMDSQSNDRFKPVRNPYFDQQQRSLSSPLPVSDILGNEGQAPFKQDPAAVGQGFQPPKVEKWTISTVRPPQQLAVQSRYMRIHEPQSPQVTGSEAAPPQNRVPVARTQMQSTASRFDAITSDNANGTVRTDARLTQDMPTEGIRQPPWNDQQRTSMDQGTGVVRKRSVTGPRAPPRIDTGRTRPPTLAYEHKGAPRSASPEPTSRSNMGFMKQVFTNRSSHNIGSANRSSHNVGVLPSPSTSMPGKEKSNRFSLGLFGKKKDDSESQRRSMAERPSFEKSMNLASIPDERRLPDGTVILFYAGALWDYEAKIPSEMSFRRGDHFAILFQHSDGWWLAELLDPKIRKRGLVPGNYMKRL